MPVLGRPCRHAGKSGGHHTVLKLLPKKWQCVPGILRAEFSPEFYLVHSRWGQLFPSMGSRVEDLISFNEKLVFMDVTPGSRRITFLDNFS